MPIFHNPKLVSDIQKKSLSNLSIVGTDKASKQILSFGTTEKRVLTNIEIYYVGNLPGLEDVLVSFQQSSKAGFFFIEDFPLSVIGNKIGEVGLCEKPAWKSSSSIDSFIVDKNDKIEISVKSGIEVPINSIFVNFTTYRIS